MKQSKIEVTPIHPERWGDDLDVVNAARVSFDKKSDWVLDFTNDPKFGEGILKEADSKLISYLAKHKHTSPFNHSFITMRVKAPIFVARQLVKHKFMPWNEISRRYVDSEPEFYFPDEWRGRPEGGMKQGSSGVIDKIKWNLDAFSDRIHEGPIHENVKASLGGSLQLYNTLLKSGVAPEQARMVLPQNMMTEWIWSGTLGAWLDMIKLRRGDGVQEETKEVARIAYGYILQQFPISAEAYVSAN